MLSPVVLKDYNFKFPLLFTQSGSTGCVDAKRQIWIWLENQARQTFCIQHANTGAHDQPQMNRTSDLSGWI